MGWPQFRFHLLWTEAGVEHRCSMNKILRPGVHLELAELQLPLHNNITSHFLDREDDLTEKITAGIFWGNTGKTKPIRTSPKGVFSKASVTNSHVPSFSNFGFFERMTRAGPANVYTRT